MEIDFRDIYTDMLTQFPKEELKSYEEFQNLLKLPQYKLFVLDKDNKHVGYSLWFKDYEMKFIWLDYIAIFKEFHSKGYGSVCIKEFVKFCPF